MSTASDPIEYANLIPANPGRVGSHWLTRYAADLLLLAFALLICPNVATAFVFGPSTQFFRGWLNLEFSLIVAAYVLLRRWPLLILLGFEIIADLIEPVAHTFYFTPTDGVEALRFLSVLPPGRLLLYILGLGAYVAILLALICVATRRLKYPRLSAAIILTGCCLVAGCDLLSGRYVFTGMDKRSIQQRLGREPLISISRKAEQILLSKHSSPPQQIDSSVGRLLKTYGSVIRDQRPNVVVVLVESWGWLTADRARDRLAAPLKTAQTRSRYVIETGAVPFVGATVFGESREFCGQIFGEGIENTSLSELQKCRPAEFARMGYDTLGINGFYPRMYGRIHWYPRLFQRWLFAPQLTDMGLHTCPGGLVGTCDEDVAELIHRELLAHPAGRPLLLHWTSLNSHLPVQGGDGAPKESECTAFAETRDDAVCTWYSLVKRALKAVDKVAVDPALSPTIFVLVGDHAPPFLGAKRRAEFSQTQVPYLILTPESMLKGR
jgi:Sulfatase